MKIGGNYSGFNISSKGLSIQRKKMNIIAENIANAETTRTANGQPYKRKFLRTVSNDSNVVRNSPLKPANNLLRLTATEQSHIQNPDNTFNVNFQAPGSEEIKSEVVLDDTMGEYIFMPNHPDADENGYIETSNVNIIDEMVEMIEASRNYEANLTALRASKDMAKDSLEI